jgi:hypothetical protein
VQHLVHRFINEIGGVYFQSNAVPLVKKLYSPVQLLAGV